MKNVATGWDLSHFRLAGKGFHANDALRGAKLVYCFVILLVLEERDELLVLLDQGHVAHMADGLLLLLATGASISELCDSPVSHSCLLINIRIDLGHVNLVLFHAPAPTALQAKHDSAARDTQAAKKDHHQK